MNVVKILLKLSIPLNIGTVAVGNGRTLNRDRTPVAAGPDPGTALFCSCYMVFSTPP